MRTDGPPGPKSCFGCGSSKGSNRSRRITASIVVTPALFEEQGGSIEILSLSSARCRIEWTRGGMAADLKLSEDGHRATKVPIGDYELILTDAYVQERIQISMKKVCEILSVVSYDVINATSDMARDGKVVANLENLPRTGMQYMWTSGVVTTEPILYDVRPGMYSVTPIKNGHFITHIHACAPANVGILKIN